MNPGDRSVPGTGSAYALGPSRAESEPAAAPISATVDLHGFRPLRDDAGLARLMAAFISRARQEIQEQGA